MLFKTHKQLEPVSYKVRATFHCCIFFPLFLSMVRPNKTKKTR